MAVHGYCAYSADNKILRFERPQVLMENGKPKYLFMALMGGNAGTSTGFVVPVQD